MAPPATKTAYQAQVSKGWQSPAWALRPLKMPNGLLVLTAKKPGPSIQDLWLKPRQNSVIRHQSPFPLPDKRDWVNLNPHPLLKWRPANVPLKYAAHKGLTHLNPNL